MSKETYTREEVIELLVEERTRARNIAYNSKEEHEVKKTLYDKQEDGFGKYMSTKYASLANEARQIGNAISGSNALSMGESIKDRIIKKLNKND